MQLHLERWSVGDRTAVLVHGATDDSPTRRHVIHRDDLAAFVAALDGWLAAQQFL